MLNHSKYLSKLISIADSCLVCLVCLLVGFIFVWLLLVGCCWLVGWWLVCRFERFFGFDPANQRWDDIFTLAPCNHERPWAGGMENPLVVLVLPYFLGKQFLGYEWRVLVMR